MCNVLMDLHTSRHEGKEKERKWESGWGLSGGAWPSIARHTYYNLSQGLQKNSAKIKQHAANEKPV